MTNTIGGALGDFVSSITSIATSLVQSVFALFQAFLMLLQDVLGSVVQLVQTFVKLGIDLCQGVAGFVMGKCTLITSTLVALDYGRWLMVFGD